MSFRLPIPAQSERGERMLQDILTLGIAYEESGMEFYRQNMDFVHEPLAKEMFRWLAEMEAEHMKLLENWARNESALQVSKVEMERIPDSFQKNLELKRLDQSPPKGDMADLKVIRMAYLIEKDFVHYYKKSAKLVDEGPAKDFLLKLASWEETHVQMMKDLMEIILKRNRIDDRLYPPPY